AAVGHYRHDRDAVRLGKRVQLAVLHDLEVEEARAKHHEEREDERARDRKPQLEMVQLEFRVAYLDPGIDREFRHGTDPAWCAAGASTARRAAATARRRRSCRQSTGVPGSPPRPACGWRARKDRSSAAGLPRAAPAAFRKNRARGGGARCRRRREWSTREHAARTMCRRRRP